MTTLTVTTAFPPYAVGAQITDPTAVAAILASENARNVVQTNVGSAPGLSTPSVSGLIVGGATVVSGTYYNGTPSGLTYSLDGGSAVTVSSPAISAGIYSFGITTPAAGAHTLTVTGTGGNTATSGSASFTTASGSGGGTTYTGTAPIGVSGGVISLTQSGATTGQVLQWSGSAWVPATITTSGGVTITGSGFIGVSGGAISFVQNGATTGQVPTWNGSAWAPTTPVAYTIPAAAGSLLGGSGTAGAATAVTVGSGLSLSGGTLSATGGSTTITPVLIDGTTIVASTGSPYQMQATSRVVEVNKTTGAATVINWPTAPVLGEVYTIIDGKGDAATNPITVNFPSGVTGVITGWVLGGTSPVASVVLNAAYDAISVRFTSSATTGRTV